MDNNTVIVGGNRRQRGGDWAGAFNSLDEANLWASLNTNELFVGLRCTVSGTPYTWQGAAGGWVGALAVRAGAKIACFGNSIGAGFMPAVLSATFTWNYNTAVSSSSVVYQRSINLSNGMPNVYFVCTTAGTTGNSEPLWENNSVPGMTIQDGTAIWTATSGLYADRWNVGWWHIAQALAGQPFDECWLTSWGGGLCADIMSTYDRAIATSDPDWILFGPMWENDYGTNATAPDANTLLSRWSAFSAKATLAIDQGRSIIMATPLPHFGVTSDTAGSYCYDWLTRKIKEFCRTNRNCYLWDCGGAYRAADVTNPYFPNATKTYLSQAGTGTELTITDGVVHPNYSGDVILAKTLAPLLKSIKPARPSQPLNGDDLQFAINPNNIQGGSLGANATGTPTLYWTSLCQFGSVACSLVPRADDPTSTKMWSRLVHTSADDGTGAYISQDSQSFSAAVAKVGNGDILQLFQEVAFTVCDTKETTVLERLRINGSPNIDAYGMYHGGTKKQNLGQCLSNGDVLLLKTIPVKLQNSPTSIQEWRTAYAYGTSVSLTIDFGKNWIEKK